jgi:hypothetical protein
VKTSKLNCPRFKYKEDSAMTALLFIMVGGVIGFFTAALCKAAGRADRDLEMLEAQESKTAHGRIPEGERVPNLAQESISFEKETLI